MILLANSITFGTESKNSGSTSIGGIIFDSQIQQLGTGSGSATLDTSSQQLYISGDTTAFYPHILFVVSLNNISMVSAGIYISFDNSHGSFALKDGNNQTSNVSGEYLLTLRTVIPSRQFIYLQSDYVIDDNYWGYEQNTNRFYFYLHRSSTSIIDLEYNVTVYGVS